MHSLLEHTGTLKVGQSTRMGGKDVLLGTTVRGMAVPVT